MNKIILASASPRRKQLLELADIDFQVMIPEIDESFPAEIPVNEVAAYIAQEKARKIERLISPKNERTILAADTTVVLDEKILGKPQTEEEAREMLLALSGKKHAVITGVCLLQSQNCKIFSETTFVNFHSLSIDQIKYYIQHYKPFDKAGAYGIQEWIGAVGVRSIEGDFYNVMGLPISKICQHLKR